MVLNIMSAAQLQQLETTGVAVTTGGKSEEGINKSGNKLMV
jgi:hypothetical protein